MTAWDARAYHEVAAPQAAWGEKVVGRLQLRGDETVLDAGCGSGRVTAMLLERLGAKGSVIALDRDEGMLEQAREHLAAYGDRVRFVRASLPELPSDLGHVDVVFSTATFHWVQDHDALFASVHRVLAPGGLLVAQCGGKGNLARILARLDAILREPPFAPYFQGRRDLWCYASDVETSDRLARTGFTAIETSLTPAPTPFPNEEAFRRFVEKVILGQRLAPLTDASLRAEVLDRLAVAARADDPPLVLDYVRLDMTARA